MPSLAAMLSYLGAALSPRRVRLRLSILALSLALPSLRAATFGDFQYTDTGIAISIDRYTGAGGAVVIPSEIDRKPVTRISDSAFSYCDGLTSVTIPDSVISIGYGSFRGSDQLTAINVATGNSAYASVDGVFFTRTLATLIQYPMGKPQTSYSIPNSVTSIEDSAFYRCAGLISVTIPDSVASIGDNAFMNCPELTSVTIPASLTSIGNNAFYHCAKLISLTIPASVTSIGYSAFGYCTRLTNIDVAAANSTYSSVDGVLFTKALATLVHYPAGKLQTDYTIPAGVTAIEDSAFYRCAGLISVTIPDSVASIGDNAFSHCAGLISVTIPDRVSFIGYNAFFNSLRLTNIDVASANPAYSSVDGVLFTKTLTSLLHYPAGRIQTDYTIPDGVTSIEDSAFYGCSGLISVTIPDSVASIGYNMFFNCIGLRSINVITANSTYTSVDGVLFTKALATLLRYPAGKLQTDYTIPAGVTSIEDSAFYNCSGLNSVTIPDSVTSIGEVAFSHCSGLTSMTIPDGVTAIGFWAFSACPGLTSVTIPKSVTLIEDGAFGECHGLTNIDVAPTNPSYTSVDGVLFTKTLAILRQYPAGKLSTSYAIPSSVASIDWWAFEGCSRLTSVTIPAGVTSIGDFAFYGCDRLAFPIFLGDAPLSFGDDVFGPISPAFTIYYPSSASGFTTPLWKGYPTQMGFPTYAQWIAGFGLGASAQLPDSNPSGDGLPNLVKYALWLDPALPAIDGQPVLVSEDGQLVYRVTLSLLTTGITSTIQTSADLVNWDDALTTIESSTATTVTASVSLPTSTPRRFARLAVSQP